eukprot:g62317.t1
MNQPKVLTVGLDPHIIDTRRHPGFTKEKLRAAWMAAQEVLGDHGIDCTHIMIDRGETAANVLTEAIKKGEGKFDCVMIGAGVRMDPELTPLFETLINIVAEQAPKAKLAFNSSPFDTVDAVLRWVKSTTHYE